LLVYQVLFYGFFSIPQNHTLHLLEEYVRHNEPPPTILEFIYIELDP